MKSKENIVMQKLHQRPIKSMLTPNFKANNFDRYKKRGCIMIKDWIHQENLKILNLYSCR